MSMDIRRDTAEPPVSAKSVMQLIRLLDYGRTVVLLIINSADGDGSQNFHSDMTIGQMVQHLQEFANTYEKSVSKSLKNNRQMNLRKAALETRVLQKWGSGWRSAIDYFPEYPSEYFLSSLATMAEDGVKLWQVKIGLEHIREERLAKSTPGTNSEITTCDVEHFEEFLDEEERKREEGKNRKDEQGNRNGKDKDAVAGTKKRLRTE